MRKRVASILHGAYGDYYEQMVGLRYLKRIRPDVDIIVFYADEGRRKDLAVYSHDYATEVHPWAALASVDIDEFYQYQARDQELLDDVVAHLPRHVTDKFHARAGNLKPWKDIAQAWRADAGICDIPLTQLGNETMASVESSLGIDKLLSSDRPSIGFLWRYRTPGGAISASGQPDKHVILDQRSRLFRRLSDEIDAHVLICGMGVPTTLDNQIRQDCKYEREKLDLGDVAHTYMPGYGWAIELEIIRKCNLCITMASGFSEALWLKRRGQGIISVDTPRHYIYKALWNRVPFFGFSRPSELAFQFAQPHTSERVHNHLKRRGFLPRC